MGRLIEIWIVSERVKCKQCIYPMHSKETLILKAKDKKHVVLKKNLFFLFQNVYKPEIL